MILRSDLAVAVPAIEHQNETGFVAGVRDVDPELAVADRVLPQDFDFLPCEKSVQIVTIKVPRAGKIPWSVSVLSYVPGEIAADLVQGQFVSKLAGINHGQLRQAAAPIDQKIADFVDALEVRGLAGSQQPAHLGQKAFIFLQDLIRVRLHYRE